MFFTCQSSSGLWKTSNQKIIRLRLSWREKNQGCTCPWHPSPPITAVLPAYVTNKYPPNIITTCGGTWDTWLIIIIVTIVKNVNVHTHTHTRKNRAKKISFHRRQPPVVKSSPSNCPTNCVSRTVDREKSYRREKKILKN